MGEGFHVFPDDITTSADKLLGLGQSLGGDIDSFRAQTEALAGAFGDDDLGSTLAGIYQVAADAAFDSFHDNAEGLSEIGQALRTMADQYNQIELANSDVLDQFRGALS